MNSRDRLIEVMLRDERVVVGAMSGTSVDGIDVVIAQFRDHGRRARFKVIVEETIPYRESIRNKIFQVIENGCIRDACVLNFLIGEEFSRAINTVLENYGLNRRDIDAIGSHGQTVYHMPEYIEIDSLRTRCTLQLGHPSIIAERTGIITIGDFRVRDIAVGGHGAPIIAYVDYALLSHDSIGRLVQNIGGIANVTVLPPNPSIDDVYAFDTGPGNMVIDEAVRILYHGKLQYDPNGEIAASGGIDEYLLKELLAHEYITKPPPKTTGREVFGKHFVMKFIDKAKSRNLRREDIIATLTAFVVKSIVLNYDLFILPKIKVSEVILGGGGAKNRTLVSWLRKELKARGIELKIHENFGISSKFKEALGMAFLAHETLSGIPNNVPRATGAKKSVVLGIIAL